MSNSQIHPDTDRWAHFVGRACNDSISPLSGEMVNLLKKCPDDPICLLLASSGGDSVAGFSFYEFVTKVLKPKLQTIAIGEVGSIAVLMYVAGSDRFVTRHSTFFLHEFTLHFPKKHRMSLSEARKNFREVEIDQEKYISIIIERCAGKLTPNGLRGIMKRETTLTAEDAVELGIAHHILD